MKTRRLRISPELWVQVLANPDPQRFQVVENRLPDDARCVRMTPVDWTNPPYIELVIGSDTFREDDPDELPAVMIMSLPG